MQFKYFLILLTISLINIGLYGQEGDSFSQSLIFRNEQSIGLNAYTSGFGLSYRISKPLDYFNKRNLEIELNTIKHPKEKRISNTSYSSGGKFVFGKLNESINTRFVYGKQKQLFARKYESSVTINFLYLYGIDVTFQKPVYYEILYPATDGYFIVEEEFSDESVHNSDDIAGKASFFKGFDEIKVNPAACGKIAFSFEFLTQKKFTHNLEGGIFLSVYPWELEIMALTDNQQIWYSLFATYRIGILSEPKRSRRSKRKTNEL